MWQWFLAVVAAHGYGAFGCIHMARAAAHLDAGDALIAAVYFVMWYAVSLRPPHPPKQ